MLVESVTKPEKYVRDQKVAVILSNSYGLGWSTESSDREMREFLMFDASFVERVLAGETLVNPFLVSELGYSWGGQPRISLRVEWVSVGERFAVVGYDGRESLVRESELFFG
jgi:hypothetical protein